MKRTNRESNVELLRIISIMSVILLHYNNISMGGALKYVSVGTVNYYILMALESICICAVNVFILITGYFSHNTYKITLIKPIKLISQVIIFSELTYFIQIYMGQTSFSLRLFIEYLIPANYFVILYVTLYLIMPYLNLLIKKMSLKDINRLALILVVVFSIWPTFVDVLGFFMGHELNGLSSIGLYGSQRGYTIIQFVMIYILGVSVRKFWRRDSENQSYSSLIGMLFIVIVIDVAWSLIDSKTAWAYFNPLVVAEAILIFCIFLKFPAGNIYIINKLSEGCFSVFLLHSIFIPHIRIESFVNRNAIILISHIICSITLIFLLCWGVHWIYEKIANIIFNKVEKKVNFFIEIEQING